MSFVFDLFLRYPIVFFGSYWSVHVAFFGLASWGSFETFDGSWWRDLCAHAVAGYMLVISLYASCSRPRKMDRGTIGRAARCLSEWFITGRSYSRVALFSLAQGGLWEVIEWSFDRVRGYLPYELAAAQGGAIDTLLDIAIAIPAGVLALASIKAYEGRLSESVRLYIAH